MKINNGEIDESLYSEKTLFLLNIKELRDLGRKFGVPSPTTMKKKELIDYILKVVYGEIDAPVRSSYGRPSVREFDINKYLSKIKKNAEISSELKAISLEDFGTMKLASYKEQTSSEEIETRVFFDDGSKCYLKIREFVSSDEDIEISKELAKKFKLENLDVVEIARADNILFKIISINGLKVKTNFENLEILGEKLYSGVSRDFYFCTKEEITKQIEILETQCEENDVKLYIFSTNSYSGKNTVCVEYDETEENSKTYKKLASFIRLCEKATFEGQDFIVAFENGQDIENMVSLFEEDVSDRIKKYLQSTLPKFAALGNIMIMFMYEEDREY